MTYPTKIDGKVFQWQDPLRPIFESNQNDNNILKTFLDYHQQFLYLEIINTRIEKDIKHRNKLMDLQKHLFTQEDQEILLSCYYAKTELQLDTESIFINARILMDKVAK